MWLDHKESPNEALRTQPSVANVLTLQHVIGVVEGGSYEDSENMKFLLSLGDSELKMKELKQSADHIVLTSVQFGPPRCQQLEVAP